jgi:lipopolysaccharide biosynthesis glycosyltransferase
LKINFKNILIKFIFLSFFKCLLYSIKSLLKTDFGLLKFRHEERKTDYQDKYNHLKYKYQSYSFLNSFLKEINLISHDYTSKLKSDNKKVHIISNLDNKYFYPSIVSINSVLRNSNKNKTTIVYHILFHEDLSRKKINKLKSLLLLYPTNLEMIFYNMGNLFSEYKGRRFNNVAFYRLLAPIFIPVEKIIYLDSDVLVFKDLEEMYNLDLKNNYILGFLDILSNGVDYLGLKSEKYINSGVLLINLDLIRKHQKYYEILYMYKNNKKLENNDQTIINYVFYPNIGILPSKFGIFNFDSIIDIKCIYI